MNDIMHLIFSYADIKTFYNVKNIYNLNEKLYWKGKTQYPEFIDAVKTGSLDCVKYLRGRGQNFKLNYLGNTIQREVQRRDILTCAISHRYFDIVKYLHDLGYIFTQDHNEKLRMSLPYADDDMPKQVKHYMASIGMHMTDDTDDDSEDDMFGILLK